MTWKAKIRDNIYDIVLNEGKYVDGEWGRKDTRELTIIANFDEIYNLFTNNTPWGVYVSSGSFDEEGNEKLDYFDQSHICIVNKIKDNCDGTVTVFLSSLTDLEKVLVAIATA